ncbi:hypothetical protein [Chitinimonas naiadis]
MFLEHRASTGMLPIALLLATLFSQAPAQASGGGDGYDRRVGTSHVQPEPDAMPGFLKGQLGVLWPSYDRSYLMLAYRQAKGLKPASDANLAALLQPRNPSGVDSAPASTVEYGTQAWITARKQFGLANPTQPPSPGWLERSGYAYIDNCQPGAFELAAKTLAQRQQAHGKEGDWVRLWVSSQDSVFSACDKNQPLIPMPPLPAKAPKWLEQDRAYQLAAMLFYQDKLEEAGQAFEAIAKDKTSAWHEWAGYLIVRSWWRQNVREPADYKNLVADAAEWPKHAMAVRLKAVAADAKDEDVKEAARGLYDALTTRFDPKGVYLGLWQQMDAKEPVADIDSWVASTRWMWAILDGAIYRDDWLYATRSVGSEYASEAETEQLPQRMLTNWQQSRSPVWLASALMTAVPKSADGKNGGYTPAQLDELIKASREYKPDHPLYLHFAWQRTRLALCRQDYPAARSELAAVAPQRKTASLGTRQAFDQLEMLAAPSLKQVGQHLVRTALGRDYMGDAYASFSPEKPEDFIDDETLTWLTQRLDGQELLELAQDSKLPVSAQRLLATQALLWASFLPDPVLEQAAIKVWAPLALTSEAVAKATSPEAARFEIARLMLLKQIAVINTSDDYYTRTSFTGPVRKETWSGMHWGGTPAFHNAEQQAKQQAALLTLSKVNSTTWMGQQILPWMRKQPKFAEGPAILEKLVYASRYGMRDTPTSKQAFQLLHKQYPNSEEAQRTRYFY